jgi:hypothetical protein
MVPPSAPHFFQATANTAGDPPSSSPRRLIWFAIGIAVVVHVTSAWWQISFGAQNVDEGFYAVATRAVTEGEIPFRDFGFPQPPLVLYANCLPMRFVGFGLFAQRSVNAIWTAIALIFAARWLGRRTRPAWGVALAVLFSFSAPWMYFTHLGKTYGLATLLVMLSGRAFLKMPTGPRRNFVLGLIAALGLATRLPTVPFFGILWLLALFPQRLPGAKEALAGCAGLATFVSALPFWFAAPLQVKFWLIDLHRLSLQYRDWHVEWREIVSLAPAVWVITAMALGIVALRRRILTREFGVVVAALAATATNLLPQGAYQEYGVPYLLPLAAASAALLYDELKMRNPTTFFIAASAIVTAHLATAPLLSHNVPSRNGTFSWWLTPNTPAYNRALPTQIAAARSVVEQVLPPNAPFIGPNIILAAETGRIVPPELRMGPFSFTVEMTPEEAARLHLTTHEKLDEWFARRDVTLLAFFQRRELNYGWTMPTFGQLPQDLHGQWFAPIRRDFTSVYETKDDFLLLVRKSP